MGDWSAARQMKLVHKPARERRACHPKQRATLVSTSPLSNSERWSYQERPPAQTNASNWTATPRRSPPRSPAADQRYSKALRKAVRSVFGEVPLQLCLWHKERNVMGISPSATARPIKARMRTAWRETDYPRALEQLQRLADELEYTHPAAAGSLREGMDKTLTATRLGTRGKPRRTLGGADGVDHRLARAGGLQRNVKRWSSGEMGLRWTAAGMLEAENSSARSSATPTCRASLSRSSDDSTFPSPIQLRPRRPRSQSLCNDHNGAVVTEVPRRLGQPRSSAACRTISARSAPESARAASARSGTLGDRAPTRSDREPARSRRENRPSRPALSAVLALLRAAITRVARRVMHFRVAAVCEVAIAGCLIAIRSCLFSTGGGLVTVRTRLVSLREELVAISQRLIVPERLRNLGDVELAQRNPEHLTAKMGQVNQQKSLVRLLPTEEHVAGWIQEAKSPPPSSDALSVSLRISSA
jgi:hypothetical protein